MNKMLAAIGGYPSRPSVQNPIRFLLRTKPKTIAPDADTTTAPEDKPSARSEDVIVCRQCRHVITAPMERRDINGAHSHTFANPEGIIFEIICFYNAWGCAYVGPASAEFTWFSGYVWRIAVCANCHVHLGWRFSTSDGRFFHGLITSRLIGIDI